LGIELHVESYAFSLDGGNELHGASSSGILTSSPSFDAT
jgi:hypothetical protein